MTKKGKSEEIKVKADERQKTESGALDRRLAAFFEAPRSPFTSMRRFAEDMERIFGGFGFEPRLSLLERDSFDFEPFSSLAKFTPALEMEEHDGKLIVRADLPGMEKDDIDVEITDGQLTIRGERKSEMEEAKEGFFRTERSYGKFFRRLPLPASVETKDATAKFANGVLEISMSAPTGVTNSRKVEIGEGKEISEAASSGA